MPKKICEIDFDELNRKTYRTDDSGLKLQASNENSGIIVAFLLRTCLTQFREDRVIKNYEQILSSVQTIGLSGKTIQILPLVFEIFGFKAEFLKYLKICHFLLCDFAKIVGIFKVD